MILFELCSTNGSGCLNVLLDVPNSGRGLPRLAYRTKEWDVDFRNYLKKLDATKPVILCGDLNVAHHEIGNSLSSLSNFILAVDVIIISMFCVAGASKICQYYMYVL